MPTPIALLLPLLAPGDELLVASFQPAAVQRFDAPSGTFELAYGASPLGGTLGLTAGPDGLVYVASEATDEVLRFAVSGAFVDAFVTDDPATPGDETGGLDGPSSVLFGPDGRLYVASFEGDAVLRYDGLTGAFVDVFVAPGDGGLDGPDAGMVFGPGGDLYVPSYWNHRVKRYDGANGSFVSNFLKPVPSGLKNPRTVLFLGDGFVYAASEGTDQVLRFDALTGDFDRVLVGDDPNTGVDESGGLDAPTGLGLGPDGHLWVASLKTDAVKRYALDTGAWIDDPLPTGAGGVALPTYLLFRPRAGRTCAGAPSSTGVGTTLIASGSTSVSANRFGLEAHYGPPGRWAVALQGQGAPPTPFGDGELCLGAPLFRLAVLSFDPVGHAALPLDLGTPPVGGAILPASTWHFQLAYRDPGGPGGSGWNASAALRAHFDL